MTAERSEIGFYIPFWGSLSYLKDVVESVLAQTDDRWTLTVVNDAHPDGDVDKYFEELTDFRVRYIRLPENVGITANFRYCVSLAVEPLVVILGYDDLVLPRYVETVLRAYELHPEATIIQPGVRVIDAAGNTARTLVDSVKQRLLRPAAPNPVILEGDRLAASLMLGNWLYWPSLAFERDSLKKQDFRDEFSVIQDLALILDLLIAGGRLLVIDVEVFCYRRHTGSASAAELVDGARFRGEREFFRLAIRLAEPVGWRRTRRAARLHLTSRLHSLALVPRALTRGDGRGLLELVRHTAGS
ncbi:glycosyltransferase family 2 protein [Arthrobacter sedimenti]|uniref:glycosyltransferase family 2 protein n=1 Tax=Arthrobacter sedimenti TaxID=2694931 RepID=UPI000B352245|nr:glycosyltransferase family 2 protein [Arthrobacter sedimenti]OUM39817.1 glycosyl transferase [Arthrobacter agilis]